VNRAFEEERGLYTRRAAMRGGDDASDLKQGEPQDRLQGAINLQGVARRKPLKPGGTARAERARRVASSRRGWATARDSCENKVRTCGADTGGEAIFGKPHERSFALPTVATQGGDARPRESRRERSRSLTKRRRRGVPRDRFRPEADELGDPPRTRV